MSANGFVWYELMTTDCKAAEAFYGAVVGWTAADSGLTDRSYTIISAGPHAMGGMMAIPAEAAGMRPHWGGYIGVEDVDDAAQRVSQAGGSIHHGPDDIPGVGRFAVAADPQGAVFILFKGFGEPPPGPPVVPGTPGHTGWHELHAVDGAKALDFYAKLFNWTWGQAVDMGAMGVYQIFGIGGEERGGIMNKPDAEPVPSWLYYFNVEDINAAAARVRDNGGQVMMGPHEVPGGSWIVVGMDPQGAVFALVKPAG